MTTLNITSFLGSFPQKAPILLPANAAQRAVDCDYTSGALRGRNIDAGTADVLDPSAQGFYELPTQDWMTFSDPEASATRSLFGSIQETVYSSRLTETSLVNDILTDAGADFFAAGIAPGMFVRNVTTDETRTIAACTATTLTTSVAFSTAPMLDDIYQILYIAGTDQRVYYTSTESGVRSRAYVTTIDKITAAEPAFFLGVPRPSTALTVTPVWNSTPTDDDEDIDNVTNTTNYVYTYESKWGEESRPSRASADISFYVATDTDGASTNWTKEITLSGFIDPPTAVGYANIDKINIYRAVSGTLSTEYQFLASLSIASAVSSGYTDTDLHTDGNYYPAQDTDLGMVNASVDHYELPIGAKGLCRFTDVVLATFKENEIFFSKPNVPHAWPKEYVLTLPDTIIALCATDSTLVAFTEYAPVVISGEDPARLSVAPVGQDRICTSPYGIVPKDDKVIFPTSAGLLKAARGDVTNLTQDIFSRSQWAAMATDLRVTAHEDYIYFSSLSAESGYRLDLQHLDAGVTELTWPGPLRAFHKNKVLCFVGGAVCVYEIEHDCAYTQPYEWTSKVFTCPQDTHYTCAQIIASQPMQFSYKIDNETVYFQQGTAPSYLAQDSTPFWLPHSPADSTLEFTVQGSGVLQAVYIASSPQELI